MWLLDELLDRIPSHDEDGWHRYGDWGCRLRLFRWWDDASSAG